MSTQLTINQTNVPGAVIKLAGPTVRDLIDALEQLDPDTRTTVKRLKLDESPRLAYGYASHRQHHLH